MAHNGIYLIGTRATVLPVIQRHLPPVRYCGQENPANEHSKHGKANKKQPVETSSPPSIPLTVEASSGCRIDLLPTRRRSGNRGNICLRGTTRYIGSTSYALIRGCRLHIPGYPPQISLHI